MAAISRSHLHTRTAAFKGRAHIEVLYVFIGGNLSVERLSPLPPSKDV